MNIIWSCMGLIACVCGEWVVCGDYRPGLEKGSPKWNGTPGQWRHKDQDKLWRQQNRVRVQMCDILRFVVHLVLTHICRKLYFNVPFLFKEIHPTVPYIFFSFTGVVLCHFGSLVPLTFPRSSRGEQHYDVILCSIVWFSEAWFGLVRVYMSLYSLASYGMVVLLCWKL